MGQGQAIRAAAARLKDAEWMIVFVCVPNTAHVNVVPIPTKSGASKQRYPDVVAYKGTVTRFIEVEMVLNEHVAKNIVERFSDITDSLSPLTSWKTWRDHVLHQTGHNLPHEFNPKYDLVICGPMSRDVQALTHSLSIEGICVSSVADFEP